MRIRSSYAEYEQKPEFDVSENAVRVTLPVTDARPALTSDEELVYRFVKEEGSDGERANCRELRVRQRQGREASAIACREALRRENGHWPRNEVPRIKVRAEDGDPRTQPPSNEVMNTKTRTTIPYLFRVFQFFAILRSRSGHLLRVFVFRCDTRNRNHRDTHESKHSRLTREANEIGD